MKRRERGREVRSPFTGTRSVMEESEERIRE